MIESEEELEKLTEGTVVIRSHGVPKSICEKLKTGTGVCGRHLPFREKNS